MRGLRLAAVVAFALLAAVHLLGQTFSTPAWIWTQDTPYQRPEKASTFPVGKGDLLVWREGEPVRPVEVKTTAPIPGWTKTAQRTTVVLRDLNGRALAGIFMRWQPDALPSLPYPMACVETDKDGRLEVVLAPGERATLWCDDPAYLPQPTPIGPGTSALELVAIPAPAGEVRFWDDLGRDASGARGWLVPLAAAANPLAEVQIKPLFTADGFGRSVIPKFPPGLLYVAGPQTGMVLRPSTLALGPEVRLPAAQWQPLTIRFDPPAKSGERAAACWTWVDKARPRVRLSLGQFLTAGACWMAVPEVPSEATIAAPGRGTVHLKVAPSMTPVTVTLSAGVALQGRVVDEKNVAVPDAEVRVGEEVTETDSHGRFALSDVPSVALRGSLNVSSESFEGAEVPLASQVDLKAILVVLREGGAGFSGQVVGPQGSPVAGAGVSFVLKGKERWLPDAKTDEDGRFLARGFPLESYTFKAMATGFKPYEKELPLAVPGVTDLGVIRLSDTPALVASLQDSTGTPLQGCTATLEHPLTGRQYLAEWANPLPVGETGADGSFRLGGLTSGPYMLRCRCPGTGALVKPVTIGEADVDLGTLTVQPSGRIEGLVIGHEGQGVAGDLVKCLTQPLDLSPSLAFTDSSGAFTFEEVPSGTYVLAAFGPSDSLPAARARVRVECGETAQALLRATGAELRLTVTVVGKPADRSDLALKGQTGFDVDPGIVRFCTQDGCTMLGMPPLTRRGTTDNAGLLTLEDVPPGPAEAELNWQGLTYRTALAVPDSGGDLALDFQGITLSGQVIDEDGDPVGGAYVWPVFPKVGVQPGSGVVCDALGRFTLRGLGEGTLTLMAKESFDAPGFAVQTKVELKAETATPFVQILLQGPPGEDD